MGADLQSPGALPHRLAYAGELSNSRLKTRRSQWRPPAWCVLGLLMFGGMGLVRAWWKPATLGQLEQRMVLQAKELPMSWCEEDLDPALGSFDNNRRLDGSVRLEYRYKDPSRPEFSIECTVQRFSTEAEAKADQSVARVRMLFDWRLDKRGQMGLVEQHEAFRQGVSRLGEDDELYAFRVEMDNEPVGQALAVRIGSMTYDLVLHGACAPDAEEFAEMLLPRLSLASRWNLGD